MSTANSGFAPVLKSHARLYFDIPSWAEKLPDGRSIRDVDPAEFGRAVNKLGLGLDQSLGHEARVKQYIEKLGEIYHAAGAQAVTEFKAGAPR